MAFTVAQSVNTVFGDRRVVIGTLTFDNSYDTGGDAVTPAALGLTSVIDFFSIEPSVAGFVPTFDKTNSKVLVFQSAAAAAHAHTAFIVDATAAAGDETAFVPILDGAGAAVDAGGVTIGHAGTAGADVSVPTSSNGAVAAGALAEVGAADVDAEVFQFMVVGK